MYELRYNPNKGGIVSEEIYEYEQPEIQPESDMIEPEVLVPEFIAEPVVEQEVINIYVYNLPNRNKISVVQHGEPFTVRRTQGKWSNISVDGTGIQGWVITEEVMR